MVNDDITTTASGAVPVLRRWIHQALLANGYTTVTPSLDDDGTYGMFPPVEYILHDDGGTAIASVLTLRGLVVGKKYMLHCEQRANNSDEASISTWRVDFPLSQYIPTQASLFPRYQEFVRWRVRNSVVQHGSSAAQALLSSLPTLCIASILSFLDVSSLCALRVVNKTLHEHATSPSIWKLRVHIDFPTASHDPIPTSYFTAYANAVTKKKREQRLRLRLSLDNMLWFDREAGRAHAQRNLALPLAHIPRLPFEAPSP
ncbi:hypothetical protein H257_15288 [Aphanomyces astaci]|uniref:F-box domain-containing protein n=1 Tax=Aphanomyces astaci TaxID=112090 RepID=W4FNA6_APHAT|nr:hypothetical protein H257_15288 [Aphanomyces astaci]ETV68950.1 hypothetical protein H257_15288 [Aphanomyces astaci]|eukprot:XP_009841627.1 hypothetical protein H257_15288 [Aphanomyces astaci]